MRIYTSYFAKEKSLPSNLVPVCISRTAPAGTKAIPYPALAPTAGCLWDWKAFHDEAAYRERYQWEILDKLDPHQVVKDLEALSGGQDVVLMCWGKAGSFCHRYLDADWLRAAGYNAVEWGEMENIQLF